MVKAAQMVALSFLFEEAQLAKGRRFPSQGRGPSEKVIQSNCLCLRVTAGGLAGILGSGTPAMAGWKDCSWAPRERGRERAKAALKLLLS